MYLAYSGRLHNTSVGVYDDDEELWISVFSKHGIGVGNLAGEELLQFCEVDQLSVINSFYKKQHLGKWTHSGTKVRHMIGFVTIRTSQRNCCMDVQVM